MAPAFLNFLNRTDAEAMDPLQKSSFSRTGLESVSSSSPPPQEPWLVAICPPSESRDFWLKMSAFLGGGSLAPPENLAKYNGLVKMLVSPKDDL